MTKHYIMRWFTYLDTPNSVEFVGPFASIEAACEWARDIAATAMLAAVKFTHPPKAFGEVDGEPNLCYEARIPVQFVTDLEAALAGEREG